MTPSALTEGALIPTSIPKGLTVLQHLHTAPLVVRVKGIVTGRTGWSVMVRCKVLKGTVEQKGLGPILRNKLEDNENADIPKPSRVNNDTIDTDLLEHQSQDTFSEVLLVLQPLPPECPKLGLDARILALKPPTSELDYEIGIWPAWTDTTYDTGIHDEPIGHRADPRSGQGMSMGGDVQRGVVDQKVVFASRYLIAETTVKRSQV